MKERILIVEDKFDNLIAGLVAFQHNDNIEDMVAVTELQEALRKVSEFKPTLALLDIHIINGFGTEVGKVLTELNIPFLYVTGVSQFEGHDNVEAIEIQDKNFKTLARYEEIHKSPEMWAKAYGIIKEM